MTRVPTGDQVWSLDPELVAAYERRECYDVHIDMTLRCHGGCTFCFMSSVPDGNDGLTTEKLLEVVDDTREIGARKITWYGGEPLLRPNWVEVVRHAHRRGLRNDIRTGCQPLHQESRAREVVELQREGVLHEISLHFDSFDRADFMRTRRTYDTYYDEAMRGVQNLVRLGYPKDLLSLCIVQTRNNLGSFRATVDWAVETLQLPLRNLKLTSFRPCGFGKDHPELECTVADLKRNFEYICELQGWDVDRTPCLHECSRFYCGTMLHVEGNGEVVPCSMMHRVVGNVNERRLRDIFRDDKDTLLLLDLRGPVDVHGKCASCSNLAYCFGCRANAYNFKKSHREADPKCWVNSKAAAARSLTVA